MSTPEYSRPRVMRPYLRRLLMLNPDNDVKRAKAVADCATKIAADADAAARYAANAVRYAAAADAIERYTIDLLNVICEIE